LINYEYLGKIKGGENVEKNGLNSVAFGYAIATVGGLLYLALRIVENYGYGSRAYLVLSGVIISRSASTIWIVPELIQMAILGFLGGYLIATVYNRFA
jgi:hypothetical protein